MCWLPENKNFQLKTCEKEGILCEKKKKKKKMAVPSGFCFLRRLLYAYRESMLDMQTF